MIHYARTTTGLLRLWMAPALLALALPGMAAAQAAPAGQDRPATRPADRQPDQRGDNRDGRGGRSGQDGDRGGSRWREPTAEEWDATVQFLQEHSPQRLEIYQQAVKEWREKQPVVERPATQEAELPRSIRGARARIFGRVHFLRLMEQRDRPVYELALKQFRLEDQIIGSLRAAQRARKEGDEAAETRALDSAREAVREYALGTLEEREARIARMREELNREEQRLEQDRSNLDGLVERLQERFQRMLPGSDRERDGRDGERDGSRGDGRDGPSDK